MRSFHETKAIQPLPQPLPYIQFTDRLLRGAITLDLLHPHTQCKFLALEKPN